MSKDDEDYKIPYGEVTSGGTKLTKNVIKRAVEHLKAGLGWRAPMTEAEAWKKIKEMIRDDEKLKERKKWEKVKEHNRKNKRG